MPARFQTATVYDLVAALRSQQTGPPPLGWRPDPGSPNERTISVHGAHHGAGASTVSVALTDVLASRSTREVTLVDLAVAEEFGASEARQVQADLGVPGWSGGRRGRATVVRMRAGERPAVLEGDVVIDACEAGGYLDLDVLVCRASMLSVRRAEALLLADPRPDRRRRGCVEVAGVGPEPGWGRGSPRSGRTGGSCSSRTSPPSRSRG